MSSFSLKILAMITMLIDHIGIAFFPSDVIWRLIGRVSFPIFAFQLGVGFSHSKNKVKHIFLMLIFAIVSQIPCMLFNSISETYILNIGFTLLFGLLCLYALENIEDKFLGISTIIFLFAIAAFLPLDYGIYGVALILLLYIFRDKSIFTIISVSLLTMGYCYSLGSWYQMYSLFALFFILLYNNKKGRSCKWLFYIFYPTHLLVLYFIRTLVF